MNSNTEKAMALAGLLQSCYLVSGVARNGLVGEDSMSGSLESIFVTNPDQTADVYRNGNGIRTGLRLLMEILGDGNYSDYIETVRYASAILTLEKQLRGKPEILRAVGAGLSSIQEHQFLHELSVTNEEVVDRLSGLYERTLGTVEPRIRVMGQQKHLQNQTNPRRIRALLLAGLRSAVLWRQLGGSLIGLFLGRRRFLNGAASAAEFIR